MLGKLYFLKLTGLVYGRLFSQKIIIKDKKGFENI